MHFNPKWIKGKTVAQVDLNPFPKGLEWQSRRGTAHNPVIWFTDGSSIRFITEETENDGYGTAIAYRKATKGE